MQDIKLYYKDECPFCQKVLRHMEEHNLAVDLADIKGDPKHQEDLIKLGGKDQVPMLLIDGKPLYESDDIIQWFKDNR